MLSVAFWKIMKDFFLIAYITQKEPFRGVLLKKCSTGEHSCRSAISICLPSNFDYWIFNACSQESNTFMYMYKVYVPKKLQLFTSVQRCYNCQVSNSDCWNLTKSYWGICPHQSKSDYKSKNDSTWGIEH